MTRRVARAARLCTLALAAVLPAPLALAAQDVQGEAAPGPGGGAGENSARADRLTGEIDVDGRLDEAVWGSFEPISGFIQAEPVEGVAAEHDTEVRVAFDDEAIYVSARMYDPEPSTIARQLVRRDGHGQFDWFAVALDPDLDLRTGYVFQVSAAGVQSDRYLFDDSQRDQAWDAVWESAVRIDSLGWTAEMRIPLSQIRYEPSSGPQTWGVNFARQRVSSAEKSYFVLISQLRDGIVSQFGLLRGVEVAGSSRRIEVRPYALASAFSADVEEGNPFFDGSEQSARVGVDLSYGITSAFSLDATINPDFGQVEADPAVINLSAFETFFQERRPFFVEDARVFDFSLSGRQNQLFYSRRIGRQPHGDVPDAADFADIPDNATILGAAKVTGRTSGGLAVGALAALTQAEHARAFFAKDAAFADVLVEPRSDFGVVSVQRPFNDGASQVGGMVTGMRRSLPGDGSFDWLPSSAFNAGVRFEHQWGDRTWALWGFLAGSHVRGDSTAILRLQRASNHYFQRPDATRLDVDSTATSLTGAEWRLQFERRRGEHWTYSVWAAEVTSAFEINDAGFSQSAERLDGGFRVGYREINPGDWYQQFNLNFNTFHNWSHEALDDGLSWGSWGRAHLRGSFNLGSRVKLLNYWDADVNLSWSPDSWSRSATRGGPIMKDPGNWHARLSVNTDRREPVNYELGFNTRQGRQGSGEQYEVHGQVSLRPDPRVELQVSPRVSWESNGAQYVATAGVLPYGPTFGRRYLFADLERTSVSMDTRLNVSFSPTLTLQLYAQPLLSSGDYVRYKQLSRASSYAFDAFEAGTWMEPSGRCVGGSVCRDGDEQRVDFNGDGVPDFAFRDRDFNVRSLLGNVVLRWEYRPGSTVYAVWQRSQANRLMVGDFDLGRDLAGLWDAPAENRFILKVDYWLGL